MVAAASTVHGFATALPLPSVGHPAARGRAAPLRGHRRQSLVAATPRLLMAVDSARVIASDGVGLNLVVVSVQFMILAKFEVSLVIMDGGEIELRLLMLHNGDGSKMIILCWSAKVNDRQ